VISILAPAVLLFTTKSQSPDAQERLEVNLLNASFYILGSFTFWPPASWQKGQNNDKRTKRKPKKKKENLTSVELSLKEEPMQ